MPVCRGCPLVRSRRTRRTARCGSAQVRPTTPPRTSTASASSGWPEGQTHWQQVGGAELNGSGSYRIAWIRDYVYVATSHGLYRRSVHAPRRSVLASGAGACRGHRLSTELVGDRRHRRARHRWREGPGGRRVGGLQQPSGSGRQRVLRRQRRSGHRSARITPTGDIDPSAIGRTTFSTSNGWLYAVVQDTTNDDLRGEGVFVSHSGNPAGPWTLIADTDKLADSGSALGDSTSSYYPGIQSDYNQNIVADPTRPQARLPAARGGLRVDQRRHDVERRRARTGTTTSRATRMTTTRTPARRRPTPTSTPG